MIAKKNPKADLEKKRFAFFQIGLIIAGSACLAAFEYTTVQVEEANHFVYENDDDIIVLTDIPEEPKPEPQKSQKVQVMTPDIKVVKTKVIEGDPKVLHKGQKVIIDDGDGEDCLDCGYEIADIDPSTILEISEIPPSFPGGAGAMAGFIRDNIRLPDFLSIHDQGTVYVEFVVNEDGSIEQSKVVGKVSPDLDKAALNVVNKMPKWTPGEQAGKKVRVRFTVPIKIVTH